ncbi:hypothetical protein LVD13_00645 [Flavobacteriaceae bacterium D16]|nr:hypothetical protein [Flavobacteriaceae bacterium D16]
MKMKHIVLTSAIIALFFSACKTEKKTEPATMAAEQTVLEKLAYASGYENWKTIASLKFTFNVDRDTIHSERKWIWNIAANEVTGMSFGDSVTYNRAAIDSTTAKVDAAFINDKYWMLAPFNLIWDQNNFTYQLDSLAVAPISKESLQKLTIVYGSEGGYTPGDAYDFYFGDDYLIREWAFRKSNQAEPNIVTTWEDYQDIEGLKIASMHKNPEGTFSISFTGLEATRR